MERPGTPSDNPTNANQSTRRVTCVCRRVKFDLIALRYQSADLVELSVSRVSRGGRPRISEELNSESGWRTIGVMRGRRNRKHIKETIIGRQWDRAYADTLPDAQTVPDGCGYGCNQRRGIASWGMDWIARQRTSCTQVLVNPEMHSLEIVVPSLKIRAGPRIVILAEKCVNDSISFDNPCDPTVCR